MPEVPVVLFDSFSSDAFASSWRFAGYAGTISAVCLDEVETALAQVEQAAADGLYAAGFVAYEAAAALNPDLPHAEHKDGLPLLWFALFRERHEVTQAGSGAVSALAGSVLEPACQYEEYVSDVEQIRAYIAAGDCYQVNYTFPLRGSLTGTPYELYDRVVAAQQGAFCAYLDTGCHVIASASPELFFAVRDGIITTRPMKGTARRHNQPEQDLAQAEQLRSSAKERAENLMIVDLLRNDLAIIAETGSVSVDALFEVETYPTVHQMTSTISAQLKENTGLTDIFRALFPCGSVTGAPKRRSMEIIAEVEKRPRGVYCGAIGSIAPGGDMVFSVAIRTLVLDRQSGQLTMGVGSAITWDSAADAEYAECLGKAAFARQPAADFSLIESLRLEDGAYSLCEEHLDRLEASAGYFSFVCDRDAIVRELVRYATTLPSEVLKVRLVLAIDGRFEMTAEPLVCSAAPLRVAVASLTINSHDPLCRHKTTQRRHFDQARAERADCDELLLENEHGQLTEGTYHNLVVKLAGELVTPPLVCGLLPGVLRRKLLEQQSVVERVLCRADLVKAEEIWLINSVRGWRRAVLATEPEHPRGGGAR
jgi:para-aminobenzoate synthetase/4-amino-4-deoxychorismate lyase